MHSSAMTQIKAHLTEKLTVPRQQSLFSWLNKEILLPLRYLETFSSQITKSSACSPSSFSKDNLDLHVGESVRDKYQNFTLNPLTLVAAHVENCTLWIYMQVETMVRILSAVISFFYQSVSTIGFLVRTEGSHKLLLQHIVDFNLVKQEQRSLRLKQC